MCVCIHAFCIRLFKKLKSETIRFSFLACGPLELAPAENKRFVEWMFFIVCLCAECPCLAEYSDGKYYRAKLLGFSEVTPSLKLLVRHVDFGSDDILSVNK